MNALEATQADHSLKAVRLHAKPSANFAKKLDTSRSLLIDAAQRFPAVGSARPLVQASSLGAEDMVITHLINALGLDVGIFVLDTGMLHDQTLALLTRLQSTQRTPVQVYRPEPAALTKFVAQEGLQPMFKSVALRKACCQVRKLEPLQQALAGRKAWVTGLRREQSDARAEVKPIEHEASGRVKYNPLADWSWGDVWHYIAQFDVAYNPLHDDFYPSIGCAPCTRAISLGEDLRAGRWWWEEQTAKECGLHVTPPVTQPENTPA